MTDTGIFIRLPATLVERLDKLREAVPLPPSRNAMATHLLKLALTGGLTKAGRAPTPSEPAPEATEPKATTRGDRLRVARQRRQMRQVDVAKELGLSEDTVRRAEGDERYFGRYPALLVWVETHERAGDGAASE